MQLSQTAEDVAGEVRAWMGRRRRSGRSVAAELNWTEVYLSRRLSGRVPFDVTDLAALAELLDVPVTAFFEVAEGLRRAPIRYAVTRRCRVSFGAGHECDEPLGHEGPHICWCSVSSAELCRSGLGLAA